MQFKQASETSLKPAAPREQRNLLLEKVKEKSAFFKKEANKHKHLNVFLWWVSTIISLSIAILSNFSFEFYGIPSATFSAILAIILPVITAYVIFRNPQKLWLFEIFTRNKLLDLENKIELEQVPNVSGELKKEFFEIMSEANKKWLNIKEISG